MKWKCNPGIVVRELAYGWLTMIETGTCCNMIRPREGMDNHHGRRVCRQTSNIDS